MIRCDYIFVVSFMQEVHILSQNLYLGYVLGVILLCDMNWQTFLRSDVVMKVLDT